MRLMWCSKCHKATYQEYRPVEGFVCRDEQHLEETEVDIDTGGSIADLPEQETQ